MAVWQVGFENIFITHIDAHMTEYSDYPYVHQHYTFRQLYNVVSWISSFFFLDHVQLSTTSDGDSTISYFRLHVTGLQLRFWGQLHVKWQF